MNPATSTISNARQIFSMLRRHPAHWLVPAILIAGVTSAYALWHTPSWDVSQALIVRDEAAGQETPGKFLQPEQMKTLQETILELARSHGVLAAALAQVGPPADGRRSDKAWPSDEDIADVREMVKLVPPKGAEFGKTEVFYLKVREHDRRRAESLVAALCDQLEDRFQKLRDAKARSMANELEKSVSLAAADLRESTSRLSDVERRVGSDLSELRILQDANAGESPLRRQVIEIRNELRQVRSAQKAGQQLLVILRQAQGEPGLLVATPSQLLESQPALRRLKDGLIDAELATAQLQGRMSDEHPLVRGAKESQREIAEHLRNELETAVRGVESDLRLSTQRETMLEKQLAGATTHLGELAGIRAGYANLVAETRKRTEILERSEQRLADARASLASAKEARLISRIDDPDAGARPIGPGRATIALFGVAGGLLTGLGVLFLTVTPEGAAATGSWHPAACVSTLRRRAEDRHAGPQTNAEIAAALKDALVPARPRRSTWN
jgi:polysaccharide biosynthesis transport protein